MRGEDPSDLASDVPPGDAARFGMSALEGGRDIVPSGWFTAAIRPASAIDAGGDG